MRAEHGDALPRGLALPQPLPRGRPQACSGSASKSRRPRRSWTRALRSNLGAMAAPFTSAVSAAAAAAHGHMHSAGPQRREPGGQGHDHGQAMAAERHVVFVCLALICFGLLSYCVDQLVHPLSGGGGLQLFPSQQGPGAGWDSPAVRPLRVHARRLSPSPTGAAAEQEDAGSDFGPLSFFPAVADAELGLDPVPTLPLAQRQALDRELRQLALWTRRDRFLLLPSLVGAPRQGKAAAGGVAAGRQRREAATASGSPHRHGQGSDGVVSAAAHVQRLRLAVAVAMTLNRTLVLGRVPGAAHGGHLSAESLLDTRGLAQFAPVVLEEEAPKDVVHRWTHHASHRLVRGVRAGGVTSLAKLRTANRQQHDAPSLLLAIGANASVYTSSQIRWAEPPADVQHQRRLFDHLFRFHFAFSAVVRRLAGLALRRLHDLRTPPHSSVQGLYLSSSAEAQWAQACDNATLARVGSDPAHEPCAVRDEVQHRLLHAGAPGASPPPGRRRRRSSRHRMVAGRGSRPAPPLLLVVSELTVRAPGQALPRWVPRAPTAAWTPLSWPVLARDDDALGAIDEEARATLGPMGLEAVLDLVLAATDGLLATLPSPSLETILMLRAAAGKAGAERALRELGARVLRWHRH